MAPAEPCRHLREARSGPAPFTTTLALEFLDGLVEGVVRCDSCHATHLLRMLDWGGARRERRVFAVAGLPRQVAEAFVREAGRRTCDPSRGEQELQALAMRADRARLLLGWDVAADRLLAVAELAEGLALPGVPWREALPPAGDDGWFRRLDLGKSPCACC